MEADVTAAPINIPWASAKARIDDVSRGVGTGVLVGGVVGVAVGSGVEVGVGVCVEVGGGVRVEVGEGVWVAVGFFASAVGVALNVLVGVDLGSEVAVSFL